MITLQGCWTVALYFGLLGVIWLPRYYVIPPSLRLWPSFLVYNTIFGAIYSDSSYPVPNLTAKKTYKAKNYTIDVEHKENCFTCKLELTGKFCTSLAYHDVLFDDIYTSHKYDVYTYETFPCFQTLTHEGTCTSYDAVTGSYVLGTSCTICSLCQKHATPFNSTSFSRKFTFVPRYSLQVRRKKRGRVILHCLSKLVLLPYHSSKQFCSELKNYVSLYRNDQTIVITGCRSFCTDSMNVIFKELYSTEVGIYLILLAVGVSVLIVIGSCISYVLSLYNELGILNLPWNHTATCPICMDVLQRFKRISTLQCGHRFCRACLHQWLYVFYHVTCPLCRQPVNPDDPNDEPEVGPPALLTVDTREVEEEEPEEVVDGSTTTGLHYSLVQSIYNIGLNVVSSWAASNNSHRSSEPGIGELDSTDTASVHTESTVDHVTSSSNEPIPLPYYPLTRTINSTINSTDISANFSPYTHSSSVYNPVVTPYTTSPVLTCIPTTSTGTVTTVHCNTYNSFPTSPDSHVIASPFSSSSISHSRSTLDLRNLYHLPHLTSELAFSDSEVDIAVCPTLQNRIARKLTRYKEKRLRRRMHRRHSASDVTSVTSVTSESELDVL